MFSSNERIRVRVSQGRHRLGICLACTSILCTALGGDHNKDLAPVSNFVIVCYYFSQEQFCDRNL